MPQKSDNSNALKSGKARTCYETVDALTIDTDINTKTSNIGEPIRSIDI